MGDLHLSAERPDILNAFYHFLEQITAECDALYILGDLFEVWMGDDIAESFALELATRLKLFSSHTPLYFTHGNRDFLVGKQYASLAGMALLPEVHRLDLYGRQTIILHGDSLCTLDKPYQRFRWFRNQAWVKFIYNHLPKTQRIKIATKLRHKSQESNLQKSYDIMDVEQIAVENLMSQSEASLMIHGHTHRPCIHELTDKRQRIVVGDWYEQGSVLKVSPAEISLNALPFDKQY